MYVCLRNYKRKLLNFSFLVLTVLKHAHLYVCVQLTMHETGNILYLAMSVYSVKQKNLVSFSLNILVFHLSCPLPALSPATKH